MLHTEIKHRGHTLLGGGLLLLLVGFFLATRTFIAPIAGTVVACPPSVTHWEFFGLSLPIYKVTGIDISDMIIYFMTVAITMPVLFGSCSLVV